MGHGHVTPNPDGSKARCGGPGVCPTCNQEAVTAGFFAGEPGGPGTQPQTVTCPHCHTTFQAAIAVVGEEGPVRMTEAAGSGDGKKPYGDVEYADPGYQKDGKKRYPLDTEAHVRAAWSYVNQSKNAAAYSAADLAKVKAKIRAAAKKLKISISEDAQEAVRQAVEAMVNGTLSFSDIAERVQGALRRRLAAEQDNGTYCWVSVVDLSVSDVVYAPHVAGMRYEDDYGITQLWECSYTITADGEVTLGDPHKVVRSYSPAPGGDGTGDGGGEREAGGEGGEAGTESQEPVEARAQDLCGRVLEALDDDEDGGRVFRMRIIRYGESRNRRRYTESVMSPIANLYEGAAAYDHHRTEEEMRSSTTAGLIGYYRNVEAENDGIYGDLHLLPSATRAAEALDATLALQEAGLSPLLGVSHDVMGHYRPVTVGGRRLQEATAIVKVNSVDLVADPAAGGQATRMVAGGTDDNAGDGAGANNGTGTTPAGQKEDDVPPSKKDILGALAEATDEELAGVGLARARATEGGAGSGGQDGGEGTAANDAQNGQGGQGQGQGQGAQHVLEATDISAPKASWLGGSMIRQKVKDAGLPEAVIESLTAELPDRITEADVDHRIAGIKSVVAITERAGLAPTTATVQITQEAREKKVAALDAFFEGRFNEGYYSFRQAFTDFTGLQPRNWGEDFNRTILRECYGQGFDGTRATESLDTSSWAQVLGDSVTRRLVAMYRLPSLQTWRQIVSSIVPVNDFRLQRISRVGGYGVLPTVGEGQPYQPLTSPPDEEATYAITKKGGTEDLTLEMIANDDVRAISNIPVKLGRAAAQTLYRFVWDLLATNVVCTYDSTALFHANHGNTANPAVLSESTLSAARVAMAQQVAYGDSKEILSLTPKFLVIPSALETLAFKLTTSAVSVSATEDATTPNIHQGTQPIKIDYFTDSNDWFLVADPAQVPTIEIGFYQGRQDPELFTQSDPNVGSMFNADKYTYKIRHPYSGTVLDHRGFYRGSNS